MAGFYDEVRGVWDSLSPTEKAAANIIIERIKVRQDQEAMANYEKQKAAEDFFRVIDERQDGGQTQPEFDGDFRPETLTE